MKGFQEQVDNSESELGSVITHAVEGHKMGKIDIRTSVSAGFAEDKSVLRNGFPALKNSLSEVFFGSKLNILLVCIPFAFISRYGDWGQVRSIFEKFVGCLSICSLVAGRNFRVISPGIGAAG
jgi:hypothetical protein